MAIARQAQFETFGPPAETVHLADVTVESPSEDDVLVEMHYSPINPADLNFAEGTYGVRPQLPAVPGNEGAGIVLKVGEEVDYVKPGDKVLLFSTGNWRSHRLVPDCDLLRLPPDIDLQQAAMLKVNPFTAWTMLHHFTRLSEGSPVLQNAANSGVGRSVIQIAREIGLKTVNMVRREELFPELTQIGATEVLLDEEASYEQVRTRWDNIQLGLNAVGGDSALRVASCLQSDGWMITFGAMGRRPLKIPNSFLIFRNLHLTGFWLNRWMLTADLAQLRRIGEQLAAYSLAGKLVQPIEAVVPFSKIGEAIVQGGQSSRKGKVLVDLRDPR